MKKVEFIKELGALGFHVVKYIYKPPSGGSVIYWQYFYNSKGQKHTKQKSSLWLAETCGKPSTEWEEVKEDIKRGFIDVGNLGLAFNLFDYVEESDLSDEINRACLNNIKKIWEIFGKIKTLTEEERTEVYKFIALIIVIGQQEDKQTWRNLTNNIKNLRQKRKKKEPKKDKGGRPQKIEIPEEIKRILRK